MDTVKAIVQSAIVSLVVIALVTRVPKVRQLVTGMP